MSQTFDPRAAFVWHNGRVLPAADVRLSPFDHGFTIGCGAFETLVSYQGRVFAFSRHWERLGRTCAGLAMPLPDRKAVRAALDEVIAANRLPEARLRITVTPGAGPMGSTRGVAADESTVIVAAAPKPAWPPAARIVVLSHHPRHERGALVGLKTTSYAENALALAAAHRLGADEAVLPNSQGQVCEGAGSNVFVGIMGRLVTPPLVAGCLAGVTRALVLELARQAGVPVEETDLPMAALASADEMFLTSTTREVQPVSHLGERPLPVAPGPFTQRLQAAWKALRERGEMDP